MHSPLCAFSIEKDLLERYQRGAVCYHNCANYLTDTTFHANFIKNDFSGGFYDFQLR